MRLCIYRLPLLLLCLLVLSACGSNSEYLLQLAKGQMDMMSRAEPIDEILADGSVSQNVADQLRKVVKIREFAVNSLHLPDTGSYHEYADLGRPYAVWNLVAAPEFSLEPKQWCFPIVGCVTYRGYFHEAAARSEADTLAAAGFDVDVYGVQAYSTLNWFDDPVLNTFLNRDDLRLAGLLFHEMAHQVVYVKGDTAFNESFAKMVEREGVHRWLQQAGNADLWQEFLIREKRSSEFRQMLAKVRERLQKVYASTGDDDHKLAAKQEILRGVAGEYAALKRHWDGYSGYDKWMVRGLNNARLASVATYHELVSAFETLLQQNGDNLEKFYAAVKELGKMSNTKRQGRLMELGQVSTMDQD